MMARRPEITIAIPLFRSSIFCRIIETNIRRIKWRNVEIIISDRHKHDNNIDTLKAIFSDDERILFLECDDNLDWVDHYNLLLKIAKGKYFMWMPHDDSFPIGYTEKLIKSLELHPHHWSAFGKLFCVNKRSKKKYLYSLPPFLKPKKDHHNPLTMISWLQFWNLGIPMRGVFRTDKIRNAGLFIYKTHHLNEFADSYWVFGVGLCGRINYCDEVFSVKRLHNRSAHSNWDQNNFSSFNGPRILKEYVRNVPNLSATNKVFLLLYLCFFPLFHKIQRAILSILPNPFKVWLGKFLVPKFIYVKYFDSK